MPFNLQPNDKLIDELKAIEQEDEGSTVEEKDAKKLNLLASKGYKIEQHVLASYRKAVKDVKSRLIAETQELAYSHIKAFLDCQDVMYEDVRQTRDMQRAQNDLIAQLVSAVKEISDYVQKDHLSTQQVQVPQLPQPPHTPSISDQQKPL